MIVYNETYIVEEAIAPVWLEWVKSQHIPKVMTSDLFDSFKLLTVLNSPNEGVTYCIQYLAGGVASYHLAEQHLESLQADLNDRFQNKFVQFNTLMQIID